MLLRFVFVVLLFLTFVVPAFGGPLDVFADAEPLCRLWDGKTRQVNALWGENPKEMMFGEGRAKVAIADLEGPG